MIQPSVLIEGLPDPLGQELVLLRDPRLTVIQIAVGPGLQYPPHNHGMEAAIGLEHSFARRAAEQDGIESFAWALQPTPGVVHLGPRIGEERTSGV